MTPTILKKWLKGLRSGEYMKGQGQLVIEAGQTNMDGGRPVDYDRFCCLGVLCDVMGVEMSNTSTPSTYRGDSGSLPDWLSEKLALNQDTQDVLAQLNDLGKVEVFTDKKTGQVHTCVPWGDERRNYTKSVLKAKTFRGIAQVIERLLK